MGEPRLPAPAPSPPTRTAPSSLLCLLLAFPAARALPAAKSSSQLFLPERAQRAQRAQAGGRLLRSCSLSCLPSGLRSTGAADTEWPLAVLPLPPLPSSPAASPRPPSGGTAPGLGGSPFLLLRAPLRRLSRRDRGGNLPPLSPPPVPTLRPSSVSHWNQFLGELGLCRRRGRQSFRAGLQGTDGAM